MIFDIVKIDPILLYSKDLYFRLFVGAFCNKVAKKLLQLSVVL